MTRSKKIRNGRSLKTFIESKYHEAVFHEVDNLDTKCVNEARDNYEKVFIKIRNILTDKPWCCDSEEDVLNMCQEISDELRLSSLIRKEVK